MAKKSKSRANVADQIAEFIGRSMGELVNRKELLQRQLHEVEGQIADVGQRVSRQFGQYAPQGRKKRGRGGLKGAADKAAAAVSKTRRQVSPSTRKKMAEAARKRWAAIKKAATKD